MKGTLIEVKEALEYAQKRISVLSAGSPVERDWSHDNDYSVPKLKQALGRLDELIESVTEALDKAEKRGEKIRHALDFIRYGRELRTMDGQALADASNNLSALRTYVSDAAALLADAVREGGEQ